MCMHEPLDAIGSDLQIRFANRRPRRAFTIVELMVSIAVISVLLALILPAVQSAREAARRTHCRSNLRQLGLAIHGYHDTHRMFPINTSFNAVLDPANPRYPTRSWLQGVLPYVEQNAVSDLIKPGGTLESNRSVAEKQIAIYLCPSDPGSGRRANRADAPKDWELALTSYKSCGGSNWAWGWYHNASEFGRFAGDKDGMSRGNGLICAGRAFPVTSRIVDIRDGASNTFAIGETVMEWTRWNWWFHSNSAAATCAIPLNWGMLERDENDWTNNNGFMSRHAAGANFALADGSVRFVSESLDLQVYRAIATIQGAEVVAEF